MDFSSSSFATNNQHAISFPAFSQQLWSSTEMKFLFYAMIFVTMVQAISIMTSSSLARRPRPIKIKNINSFIKRSNRKSRKNIRRWKILLFQNKKNKKYNSHVQVRWINGTYLSLCFLKKLSIWGYKVADGRFEHFSYVFIDFFFLNSIQDRIGNSRKIKISGL